jgi:RNA recognition motif-containing protein
MRRSTPGEYVLPAQWTSSLSLQALSFKKEIRMNIYVGNLSYEVTEEDLKQAFERFGDVDSARVIKDKYTGKSKGFGFVLMADKAQAESALQGLNGEDLKGRSLNVNEARPRSEGHRDGARRGGPKHSGGRWGGGKNAY